jgi:hypothetical protein
MGLSTMEGRTLSGGFEEAPPAHVGLPSRSFLRVIGKDARDGL